MSALSNLKMSIKIFDSSFEENKHPRGANGQFGSGGKGESKKAASTKLKAGHIQIKDPLEISKNPDFGTYKIKHENFPSGHEIEGKHITVKNGKAVGLHPSLAKQLGVETVGEKAPPTQAQKEKQEKSQEEKQDIERQATRLGGFLGIQSKVSSGRMTQSQAQEALAALIEKTKKI